MNNSNIFIYLYSPLENGHTHIGIICKILTRDSNLFKINKLIFFFTKEEHIHIYTHTLGF